MNNGGENWSLVMLAEFVVIIRSLVTVAAARLWDSLRSGDV